MNPVYVEVVTVEQVTDEILTAAEDIHNGWYASETRVDWTDLWDRLDGTTLDSGAIVDLGGDMGSPAILRIKKHIKAYRKL